MRRKLSIRPRTLPALAPRARRRGTPEALRQDILKRTRSQSFEHYLKSLLMELCRVNTTPNPDVSRMRAAEDACFHIIERELGALPFSGARLERRPINPAIQSHPHYSLLHFTKTTERPGGLSARETYAGRANLLYLVPGSAPGGPGQSVALNAHVDVVAPYFLPRCRRRAVYGRGACDDKGPVVGIVAALKVLAEVTGKAGRSWRKNVLAMFVVEEETGGNGSLSLAIDRELKRLYDCVVVSECTGLRIHPANRGAVWYRAEMKAPASTSPLELCSFIIEELEKEGRAIRAESRHKLFPQRPVQTCHGILGPFGEHPSRICGEVAFTIRCERAPGSPIPPLSTRDEWGERRGEGLVSRVHPTVFPAVLDCLEAGLAEYIGLYGDKTKPAEGRKPLLAHHYNLRDIDGGWAVEVHGVAGHMGAIRERDGALTKMAHLIRSLVVSKPKLEALAGGPVRLDLGTAAPSQASTGLVLEGGQGFLPTHSLEEVKERLRRAACRGAENYLRRLGRPDKGAEVVEVTYEKLHNVAFDGKADSPTMRSAIAAAKASGLWTNEPVVGWTVSCDARLFAAEYPDMDVLTFGPGQLIHAHSDAEQMTVDELRAAVEFWALFLLAMAT
ncbi:putative Peptidase M20 [Verrucomicrobia bacterium]|nr:putative Peptidase M20 [Verrucomicrobiota bacterium]